MNPNKLITIFIIVALLVIILGTSLIYINKTPTGAVVLEEPIKISYVRLALVLPLAVAIENGYFQDEGVTVRAIPFEASKDAVNAVINRQIDIHSGVGFGVPFAVEQAGPGNLKIFQTIFTTNDNYVQYLLVRKNSNIKTTGDLRGKKIGTYSGTIMLMWLKLLLSKMGIAEDEVIIIQMEKQLQLQALATGQIDALYTNEPFPTIAIEKGIARPLVKKVRLKYMMNPFPVGGAVVSTKSLSERPEKINKVIRALDKAVDYINKYPNEAKKLLPKYTPLDPEIATKIGIYKWRKSTEIYDEIDGIQKLADILKENGILEKNIEVKTLLITEKDLK